MYSLTEASVYAFSNDVLRVPESHSETRIAAFDM
jgi:hypothetical protein